MARHVLEGKRIRVPRGFRHWHGAHRASRVGVLAASALVRVKYVQRYVVELLVARLVLVVVLVLTPPR